MKIKKFDEGVNKKLNRDKELSEKLNKYIVTKIKNKTIKNFFGYLFAINSIVLFLYLFFQDTIALKKLTTLPKS